MLSIAEFSEPLTIAELYMTRCKGVPTDAGIYVVKRIANDTPVFMESTGGKFKTKDPSYPLEIVRENWVEGATIVYIGKAAGKRGLKKRLTQLVDFGYGKPVGHRGGRLLWHLEDNKNLSVQWRTLSKDEADSAETEAIANFKKSNENKRPFANLNK